MSDKQLKTDLEEARKNLQKQMERNAKTHTIKAAQSWVNEVKSKIKKAQ